MTDRHSDVIVLGVGSMGAAACYELSKRGYRVTGLDQFSVPHQKGSHTGQTRIIRRAYFEHPDYVPLLNRSYELWGILEDVSRSQMYYKTGLLYAGNPDGALLKGVKLSSELYNIPVEILSSAEANKIFPLFRVPESSGTILEPDAGFIQPEKTIETLVKLSRGLGAKIIENTKVRSWVTHNSGVEVATSSGSYYAQKLIITTGAWSSQLIDSMPEKLRVTRQTLAWTDVVNPKALASPNFPCWLAEEPGSDQIFYGFPWVESPSEGYRGLKIAQHNPGNPVNPDQMNRQVEVEELEVLAAAMDRFIPGQRKSWLNSKTCLYTYSPDEHFILDHYPGTDKSVVFAAGFSGHGFKFVPVIGEILADLAIEGNTTLPIGFLRYSRFN